MRNASLNIEVEGPESSRGWGWLQIIIDYVYTQCVLTQTWSGLAYVIVLRLQKKNKNIIIIFLSKSKIFFFTQKMKSKA